MRKAPPDVAVTIVDEWNYYDGFVEGIVRIGETRPSASAADGDD